MVGARLFNQREGHDLATLFGCVTTGDEWHFLKLEGDTVVIDSDRYYLDNVGTILAIFQHMLAHYHLPTP